MLRDMVSAPRGPRPRVQLHNRKSCCSRDLRSLRPHAIEKRNTCFAGLQRGIHPPRQNVWASLCQRSNSGCSCKLQCCHPVSQHATGNAFQLRVLTGFNGGRCGGYGQSQWDSPRVQAGQLGGHNSCAGGFRLCRMLCCRA